MMEVKNFLKKASNAVKRFLDDHQFHPKSLVDQKILMNFILNNEITLGDSIKVDIKNGVIEFLKPFKIVSNENIQIESKKHIIIKTSKDKEPIRNGYTYSIWLNPDFNNDGEPIQSEMFVDSNGYIVVMEAKYDENGVLTVPEGYSRVEVKYDHECD